MEYFLRNKEKIEQGFRSQATISENATTEAKKQMIRSDRGGVAVSSDFNGAPHFVGGSGRQEQEGKRGVSPIPTRFRNKKRRHVQGE